MSRRSLTTPLIGAAAILGGSLYYVRTPSNTAGDDVVANKKSQADAKRDLGMGGAGVGTNQMTGGTELGSGLRSGNTENPNRDTPRGPTHKMPADAGAVGGGPGAGNSNARAVEMKGSGSGSAAGAGGGGVSETLQGLFGTGGGREGERPQRLDTKVASHLSDTPTNRGGSPWDKHRKDVTAAAASES